MEQRIRPTSLLAWSVARVSFPQRASPSPTLYAMRQCSLARRRSDRSYGFSTARLCQEERDSTCRRSIPRDSDPKSAPKSAPRSARQPPLPEPRRDSGVRYAVPYSSSRKAGDQRERRTSPNGSALRERLLRHTDHRVDNQHERPGQGLSSCLSRSSVRADVVLAVLTSSIGIGICISPWVSHSCRAKVRGALRRSP